MRPRRPARRRIRPGPAGEKPGRLFRPTRPALAGRSGQLEPFVAVAFDTKEKVVFTSSPSGSLIHHGYPGFELKGSYRLPGPATQLAVDGGGRRLYAVVTTPEELKFRNPGDQPVGAGDLHVYDLKAILGHAPDPTSELAPEATVPVDANVSRMILSDDRRYLYLLVAQAAPGNGPAKLVRVDTKKNAADLELDFAEGAEGFCLAPGGKTLYVAVSPRGHSSDTRDRPEVGKLFMVSAETLEVLKTALIDVDPADIQADEKGLVYVSGGSNRYSGVAVVDMKRVRTVVARWPGVSMGACIRLSADQKRLYVASRKVSPASVMSWLLPATVGRLPGGGELRDGPEASLGGEIFLTPDDQFLLTRFGTVVPLGTRARTAAGSPASKGAVPRPRRLTPP